MISFLPYRLKPTPPKLPDWILEQLIDENEYPDFADSFPSASRVLRPLIEASGLSHEELCERMYRREGKTQITPEYIDQALANPEMESWLISRFLKALGIDWNDYRSAMEQQDKVFSEIYDKYNETCKLHKAYRDYGPRLFALVKESYDMPFYGGKDLLLLTRAVDTRKMKEFDPPSTKAISEIIAKDPLTCSYQKTRERFPINSYLYYRLPNEIHSYDLNGKLIASGDASLQPPHSSKAMKMCACCGGVVRNKKRVPPPFKK
jgi:hypothetical protein